MLKKCLALLVLFAIVIGCFPLGVNAQSEGGRILEQIRSMYSRVQQVTGERDLSKLCGTLVGYELYYLGITASPLILDGRDQFDAYREKEFSSGGHRVRTYPSQEYTLREALYAATNGGTKDVYNILIGFNWTNSIAGSRYGHSVVIHAILDGVMYFCEGFNTPFDSGVGTPSVCTIDAFAAEYSKWSSFEGLVLFGQKNQADLSEGYPCNAFLQAKTNTDIKDMPSTTQSVVLRSVNKGERLEATGLLKNKDNELYYHIVDSGNTAYVSAKDVKILSLRYDDVQVQDATYPELLQPGEDFTINGILRSTSNEIHTVTVRVIDELGQEVARSTVPVEGRHKILEDTALRHEIDFQQLYPGNYTMEVNAEVRNHYVRNGRIFTKIQQCMLEQKTFTVGYEAIPVSETVETKIASTGWVFEDGVWRYYQNGEFRTGWLCSGGVDYYLLADGAAATGWQEINGKMRFFSNTGAMRTGWLDDNGAVYYLLSNGVPVTGERIIDDVMHTFGVDGILIDPAFTNN